MDSLDLDLCGDLFDHIDDLLDFPNQEDSIMLEDDILRGGDSNGFQSVWQQPPQDALFSDHNTSSGFSTELPVPDEDIAQLEWLSTFVEDSFSPASLGLNDYLDNNNNKTENNINMGNNGVIPQFQIPSPVSVLDSSSSCSGGRTMPVSPETVVPSRARSKRPRPATFNPRPAMSIISPTCSITEPAPTFIPLISPTSSFTDPTHGSCSPDLVSEFENFAESNQPTRLPKPLDKDQKKKKKKRLTITSSASEQQVTLQPMPVRKCLHCEITKTPQWRAGPLGPKTLCNACGVRHKSGRLYPEYRPAASPTFVPKLHSNSHKKVLEMRGKTGMRNWP